MTYNIHVGVGMEQETRSCSASPMKSNKQHPDLVGLQEVDRGVQRTQRIDEIAELARLTKMDYAFAFNLHYQGGKGLVAFIGALARPSGRACITEPSSDSERVQSSS